MLSLRPPLGLDDKSPAGWAQKYLQWDQSGWLSVPKVPTGRSESLPEGLNQSGGGGQKKQPFNLLTFLFVSNF